MCYIEMLACVNVFTLYFGKTARVNGYYLVVAMHVCTSQWVNCGSVLCRKVAHVQPRIEQLVENHKMSMTSLQCFYNTLA